MLRRLRGGGKRSSSARSGYSGVDDQDFVCDDIYVNPTHKQQIPSRRQSKSVGFEVQVNAISSPSKSPRQEHYRRKLKHLAREHQGQERKEIKPVSYSPDDVRKGPTTFAYCDPGSNADSTPVKVAEARRTALSIASRASGRQDRTSKMQKHSYKSNNPARQRMTTPTESKLDATTLQETRLHDHDYQPTPPRQRKVANALDSPTCNEALIKVKLFSEIEKKEQLPSQCQLVSPLSDATQKLDNGTHHLISRLLKEHEERFNDGKVVTEEPLQQADLFDPSQKQQQATSDGIKNATILPVKSKPLTGALNQQTEIARKSNRQKPDPTSGLCAAAARLERPPDPPAEEWKKPIPINKVSSTRTKDTASTSKFWDDVENFPAIKNRRSSQGDRELLRFSNEHLVKVTKEPIDPEKPQVRSAMRLKSEPRDESDNISNSFSLNLSLDKKGNFDDSDISELEMFDSATVYLQDAMATATGNVSAKNYWKLKYDRLKEETRAVLEQSKSGEEEALEIGEKQMGPRHNKPESAPDLNRLFSGLTVDLDDSAAYPPLCRDGLSQTMNILMEKVNRLESAGSMEIDRQDHACVNLAEHVIFPIDSRQQPPFEQNLTNNKSLADDLTAGAASKVDENERRVHVEAAGAQRSKSQSAHNGRDVSSIHDRKQHHHYSKPTQSEHYLRQENNVITPEQVTGSPDDRQLQLVPASKDEVTYPLLYLGSLRIEATPSERVRQSLLRCSDTLMSRFKSSNQLTIPSDMDSQNLIFLCKHKPQLARKTISQTIVHYGKKVIQKREVISELNQNILLFGARHPLVGESHLKMGLLHLYEGQFIDAILHLEEALNIKATFLGPNLSDFASILMLVAFAQIALERFDECIAVLLRVRRTREDAVGYSHPEIGVILNNVACVHYELGDFQRAEALFQEALDLQRETFTADPSFLKSVSALLCNIAFLHAKNGLFSKALIELEGALQIQQEILNDENNEVDAITANIAHIMAIQKMQRGSGNMEEITNQYIAMLKRH